MAATVMRFATEKDPKQRIWDTLTKSSQEKIREDAQLGMEMVFQVCQMTWEEAAESGMLDMDEVQMALGYVELENKQVDIKQEGYTVPQKVYLPSSYETEEDREAYNWQHYAIHELQARTILEFLPMKYKIIELGASRGPFKSVRQTVESYDIHPAHSRVEQADLNEIIRDRYQDPDVIFVLQYAYVFLQSDTRMLLKQAKYVVIDDQFMPIALERRTNYIWSNVLDCAPVIQVDRVHVKTCEMKFSNNALRLENYQEYSTNETTMYLRKFGKRPTNSGPYIAHTMRELLYIMEDVEGASIYYAPVGKVVEVVVNMPFTTHWYVPARTVIASSVRPEGVPTIRYEALDTPDALYYLIQTPDEGKYTWEIGNGAKMEVIVQDCITLFELRRTQGNLELYECMTAKKLEVFPVTTFRPYLSHVELPGEGQTVRLTNYYGGYALQYMEVGRMVDKGRQGQIDIDLYVKYRTLGYFKSYELTSKGEQYFEPLAQDKGGWSFLYDYKGKKNQVAVNQYVIENGLWISRAGLRKWIFVNKLQMFEHALTHFLKDNGYDSILEAGT